MYGDIAMRNEADDDVQPLIPAATVVLIRDSSNGIEVLMLKKDSKISFGGMWVFPGGKIDAEDGNNLEGADIAARYAAAREAKEEAGLTLDIDSFQYFSHWSPPPAPTKRFATWFFAANANDSKQEVKIDQGEIKNHAWVTPDIALADHADGKMEFVVPTWVTLYHLSRHNDVHSFLTHITNTDVQYYATRVGKSAVGERIAMWAGDAGYETWNPEVKGSRRRLVMGEDHFSLVDDVVCYS